MAMKLKLQSSSSSELMEIMTLTRWCNQHLKKKLLEIEDLSTDLCDGVRLIVLFEILSQEKIGKYQKKPRNGFDKQRNVELAMKFLQEIGMVMVNVGNDLTFYNNGTGVGKRNFGFLSRLYFYSSFLQNAKKFLHF